LAFRSKKLISPLSERISRLWWLKKRWRTRAKRFLRFRKRKENCKK